MSGLTPPNERLKGIPPNDPADGMNDETRAITNGFSTSPTPQKRGEPCSCISNNRPGEYQTTEAVKLVPPFPTKAFGEKDKPHKPIFVDACIVPILKHLWQHNIYTVNSCCGHNQTAPSIVVENWTHPDNAKRIKQVIAEIDDRPFQIKCWKLVDAEYDPKSNSGGSNNE